MFIELEYKEYKRVEKYFDKHLYQIPARAVIHGNFPGRVFVDNRENPQIALVWAVSRWAYLSYDELLPIHKNFIRDVLNNEIIPVIKKIGEKRFEVYADNNISWDNVLKEAMKEYILDKHYENTFILNKEKFIACTSCLEVPDDIEICENTFCIIPEEYEKYVEYDVSISNVFGMIIKKKDSIISQCLNNGFIYDNNYFIDLDTFHNGERNKGYGTLISYKLISKMLEKGYSPLWETTTNNLPSQKVADKLGFEKVNEYPVYSISGF